MGRLILVAALAVSLSCSPRPPGDPGSSGSTPAPAGPQRFKARVVSTRSHDTSAYTQGLVWDRGTLYESDGLYGSSSLRQVDPATGEVRRRAAVPERYFAEGLALVDGRLIQLTWREGTAFVYRAADLEKTGELSYTGEGWGLCWDGERLVMSDGSDTLTFRDPSTLAPLGSVQVRQSGVPVRNLNELECVDGAVYANVWMTEDILRIDPATGEVTAVVDASGLLGPEDFAAGAEVLNGIAWMPETKTFLITGKRWPLMFEVELVPAPHSVTRGGS